MKKCEYTDRSKTETPLVKGELPARRMRKAAQDIGFSVNFSMRIQLCRKWTGEHAISEIFKFKDLRRKQHLYRVSMQREPRNSKCITLKSELSQTQS